MAKERAMTGFSSHKRNKGRITPNSAYDRQPPRSPPLRGKKREGGDERHAEIPAVVLLRAGEELHRLERPRERRNQCFPLPGRDHVGKGREWFRVHERDGAANEDEGIAMAANETIGRIPREALAAFL